jgi:rod shape-determining protein MreD
VRFLLIVFVLALAACIQTIGAALLPIDLLLVCSLCAGMVGGPAAALGVAFGAGLLQDAFSSGPFGHSAVVFLALSLAILKGRERLWFGHPAWQAAFTFAGTLCAEVLYRLLAAATGEPPGAGVGVCLLCAVLNACAAPPLFALWRNLLA